MRTRLLLGPALALVATTFAAPTNAQEELGTPPPPPPATPPLPPAVSAPPSLPGWRAEPLGKEARWYGWQTLIGVGAGDVLMIAGLATNVEGIIYLGAGAHFLTGPIVHWAHGHANRGWASLGLNIGAPLGVGLLGAGIGAVVAEAERGGGDDFIIAIGAGLGLTVGALGGPVIDIVFLSKETVEESAARTTNTRSLLPSSVMVVPMTDRNRLGLSLVGQF